MVTRKQKFLILLSLLVVLDVPALRLLLTEDDMCFTTYCFSANVFGVVAAMAVVAYNLTHSGYKKYPEWLQKLQAIAAATMIMGVGITFFGCIGESLAEMKYVGLSFELVKMNFTGFYAITHILNPLIMIISYLIIKDKKCLAGRNLMLAALPAWFYSAYYFYTTVVAGSMDDIYGIFRFGIAAGTVIILFILTAGTILICCGIQKLPNLGNIRLDFSKKGRSLMAKKAFAALMITILCAGTLPQMAFAEGNASAAPAGINDCNWMSYIPDSASLGQINMPGTHDSAACVIKHIGVLWARTQDLNPQHQLEEGVRVFDLRLAYIDEGCDHLLCCHGPADCYTQKKGIKYKLCDAQSDARNFLNAHPTETVIFAYQQERSNDNDKYQKELKDRLDSFRADPKHYIVCEPGDPIPTLGEARNHVVVMESGVFKKSEDHDTAGSDYKIEKFKEFWNNSVPQDYTVKEKFSKENPVTPLVLHASVRNGSADSPVFASANMNKWVKSYDFKQGNLYGWVYFNYYHHDLGRKIYLSNKFNDYSTSEIFWGEDAMTKTLYLTNHWTYDTPLRFDSATKFTDIDQVPWTKSRKYIDHVVVLDDIYPVHCTNWFNGLIRCKDFDLEKMHTFHTETFESMFRDTGTLYVGKWDLDISSFDKTNVDNASQMFAESKNLNHIYVNADFDLRKEKADGIFNNTSSLEGYQGTQWTSGSGRELACYDGKDGNEGLFSLRSLDDKVTSEGVDVIYDGKEHSITVDVDDSEGDVVIEYGLELGKDGKPVYVTKTNPSTSEVGEYTVYFRVTKPGYYPYEGSEKGIIRPAELKTVEAQDTEFTYDGELHSFGFALSDEASDADVTFEYADNDYPETFQTVGGVLLPCWNNAGVHKAKYTVTKPNYKDVTGEVSVVINKKEFNPDDIRVSGYDGTYDGAPHSASVILGSDILGARATFSPEAGGKYVKEMPCFTDSGTYKVYYKVTMPNYEDYTGEVEVNIRPVKLEQGDLVIATYYNEYKGSPVTPKYAVTHDGIRLTEADFDIIDGAEKSLAGDTTETFSLVVEGKGNYTGKVSAEWALGKQVAVLDVKDYEGTYDSKPHTADFKVMADGEELDGFTFKYGIDKGDINLTEKPVFTDAGSHLIWVEATKEGYNPVTGVGIVHIKRAHLLDSDLTLSHPEGTYHRTGELDVPYNGETRAITYTVAHNGITLGDKDYNKVLVQDRGYNTGIYTVTLEGKGNYEGYIVKEWAVVPGDMSEGVTACGYEGVYDGKQHGINVAIDPEGPAVGALVQYMVGDKGTFSNEYPVFTDAGEYKVTYKVSKHGYDDVIGVETVKIDAREITDKNIIMYPNTFEYDGKDKAPRIHVIMDDMVLEENEDYVIDENSDIQASDVGSYVITVKGTGNYKGSVNMKWRITNEELIDYELDIFEGEYDGKPHTSSVKLLGDSLKDAKVTYGKTYDTCTSEEPFTYTDAGRYDYFYQIEDADGNVEKGLIYVSISARKVTVKADNKTKVQGAKDPKLTYTIEGELPGISAGDITVSRQGGEKPGKYTIYVAIDGSSMNYEVTCIPGTLTIKGKNSPGTSDNTPLIPAAALLVTSVLGIVLIVKARRKNSK